MSAAWPKVKLGEVLNSVERASSPQPGTEYRQLGVRLWGEGAYEREPMDGASTKYARLYRASIDDVVVNKIWARNGSVAVVPKSLDGCWVSGEFPLFECDRGRLFPQWMHWLTKTQGFWAQCDEKAQGTSGKNRIKPSEFLGIEIPLPPSSEQQRIVARIEALAGQIREAQRLRQQSTEEAEAFVLSVHNHLAAGRIARLGDILTLDENAVSIVPDGSYPQVGVRSFGGGLFSKASVLGTETTYKKFNRLYSGALVLSQVKGWEGALAVCPDSLANWFVSPEYRTFRCIDGKAIPGYLSAIVRTEWFWGRLSHATRGVGARRERTRPEQFLNIEVPMPDLGQQQKGEKMFTEVSALKGMQEKTAAELDALLPAILAKAFRGEI